MAKQCSNLNMNKGVIPTELGLLTIASVCFMKFLPQIVEVLDNLRIYRSHWPLTTQAYRLGYVSSPIYQIPH